MQTLLDAPFALNFTQDLCVMMTAKNLYGDSQMSGEDCHSDVIVSKPEAPVGLTEILEFRSETTLGLKWLRPELIGGSKNVLYTVYMATGEGAYKRIKS
jgi:hypothetical protein